MTHRLLVQRGILALLLATAGAHAAGPVDGLPPELAEDLGFTRTAPSGGTPTPVTLGVGRERRVSFPAPVELGVPPERQGQLKILNVDRTLHLTALEAFPRTPLVARQLAGGRSYVLHVEAVKGVSEAAPIQIGKQVQPKPLKTTSAKLPGGPGGRSRQSVYARYRALTRVAAQELYGLGRLIRWHRAKRIEVDGETNNLLRGAQVHAEAVAGWTDGSLFVTAVALRNRTTHAIELDPRDLRGRWVAVTFQHTRLFPRGDPADATTGYLVSPVPFAEAIR